MAHSRLEKPRTRLKFHARSNRRLERGACTVTQPTATRPAQFATTDTQLKDPIVAQLPPAVAPRSRRRSDHRRLNKDLPALMGRLAHSRSSRARWPSCCAHVVTISGGPHSRGNRVGRRTGMALRARSEWCRQGRPGPARAAECGPASVNLRLEEARGRSSRRREPPPSVDRFRTSPRTRSRGMGSQSAVTDPDPHSTH